MRVDLPNTTVSQVNRSLQNLRESGGVVALGRVLTLLVHTDFAGIESAVAAANGASRLHPARVIVLALDARGGRSAARLDAQIRVGGDAGASEVVVLRGYGAAADNIESLVSGLMLSDAPVVCWWPTAGPENLSGHQLGRLASRRISDSAAHADPQQYLRKLAKNYSPGDGDMAWTRISLWRAQLAALFELHLERKLKQVRVIGSVDSPSADLLSIWLTQRLEKRVELVRTLGSKSVKGIAGVEFTFSDGELKIHRPREVALIQQTGLPDSSVLLPRRSDQDCLVEDMRFLGEDRTFGELLQTWLQSSKS